MIGYLSIKLIHLIYISALKNLKNSESVNWLFKIFFDDEINYILKKCHRIVHWHFF
jgi:hypothetical protein